MSDIPKLSNLILRQSASKTLIKSVYDGACMNTADESGLVTEKVVKSLLNNLKKEDYVMFFDILNCIWYNENISNSKIFVIQIFNLIKIPNLLTEAIKQNLEDKNAEEFRKTIVSLFNSVNDHCKPMYGAKCPKKVVNNIQYSIIKSLQWVVDKLNDEQNRLSDTKFNDYMNKLSMFEINKTEKDKFLELNIHIPGYSGKPNIIYYLFYKNQLYQIDNFLTRNPWIINLGFDFVVQFAPKSCENIEKMEGIMSKLLTKDDINRIKNKFVLNKDDFMFYAIIDKRCMKGILNILKIVSNSITLINYYLLLLHSVVNYKSPDVELLNNFIKQNTTPENYQRILLGGFYADAIPIYLRMTIVPDLNSIKNNYLPENNEIKGLIKRVENARRGRTREEAIANLIKEKNKLYNITDESRTI